MNRRRFLLAGAAVTAAAAGAAAWRGWPDEGVWNPCAAGLPDELARHELVRSAWEGIDPAQFWDCHVHLAGVGDGGSGLWITPQMSSPWHPLQSLQRVFYQNAACAERAGRVDADFLARLVALHAQFPPGARFVLLGFDHHHDARGAVEPARSAYHAPDRYARDVARAHPGRFEWIASIHPYREDGVARLEQAVRDGARAVKWLPSAMGIDPAAPACDRFYEALARRRVPLLTHAGEELAVHGGAQQALNNPLRLRRALEHGVRVVVAHCASAGRDVDLDRGPDGPVVESFALFARLMDEPRYVGRLYGEISATTQVNRLGPALTTLIERGDWHARLVNGSDYPLPGVMPLFSLARMVAAGYITQSERQVLSAIRRHNPLLFDFLLKRHLKVGTARFAPQVFESRRVFEGG